MNLILNVLKYILKGGKVDINIYEDNNYIVLSVKDIGVGIFFDDFLYVFERFYRVDELRNKLIGGVGIGFIIFKFIIEVYSGNIIVDSIIGKGINFVVKVLKIV